MIVEKTIMMAPDYAIHTAVVGYDDGREQYRITLVHYTPDDIRELARWTSAALEAGQVVRVKRTHSDWDGDDNIYVGRLIGVEAIEQEGGAVELVARMNFTVAYRGRELLAGQWFTSPEIFSSYPILAPAGEDAEPELHPVITGVALVGIPALRDYGAAYAVDTVEEGVENEASDPLDGVTREAASRAGYEIEAVATALARAGADHRGPVLMSDKIYNTGGAAPAHKEDEKMENNYQAMLESAREKLTRVTNERDQLKEKLEASETEDRVAELEDQIAALTEERDQLKAKNDEAETEAEKAALQQLGLAPEAIDRAVDFREKHPAAYPEFRAELERHARNTEGEVAAEDAPRADHRASATPAKQIDKFAAGFIKDAQEATEKSK